MTSSPLAPEWLVHPSDADELPSAVWSRTARRAADGVVEIGGVSVTELVAQYGTPLYVVDEADARGRAREVRAAFDGAAAAAGTSAKVYYAGKAFLSVEVARWMEAEGLAIDTCTGGELTVALAAGVQPSHIGLHGNNKSLSEIDRAVSAGVGVIVIDSAVEIERVAAAALRHDRLQAVRLRVNSGVHAHTHDFLATAHEDQKFGVRLDQAAEYVAAIRSHPSLRFLGLHCHIGSQIFGSDGFAESAARLLEVHSALLAGGEVPELNLGGGFGIAYTAADDPTPIAELAARIVGTVTRECERLGIAVPVLAFEPGRAVIGPSGTALYEVGTVKDVLVGVPGGADGTESGSVDFVRRYVSVDGGMSDNARPALYGADYSVRLASRSSAADPALVRVAGKHCESGDIVVYADYLPGDVTPGDLLAVPATGAYCWSLSSNYNYVGRPAVVAVREGTSHVLIRRETEADLLARDAAFGGDR
ncbi:diaminopimelate decarboxylase [Herbiconiux moechotypicola]|uniref:Diaminopimelate decarboxylase n=1 Tax=Herbiconiux moechotypicola TaxID=637393 RepID=A0ABP5Q360_9MICO|nr:diaminopimelate decarboxylase [Herbiconiux moechotypicola]MCS5728422.1 diaminopimelate decarboxylase [Herbiconiux moechotypicola]